MKHSLVIGACIAALAGPTLANAPNGGNGWSWLPVNTDFAGSGAISVSIPGQPTVQCGIALTARTRAGGAFKFVTLTYQNDIDGSCASVFSPTVNHTFVNPTAALFGHYVNDQIIIGAPEGVDCFGDIPLSIHKDGNGNSIASTIPAGAHLASAAGVCTVHLSLTLDGVTIGATPQ